MKTVRIIIVSAFLTGIASIASAGPSPQFFDQQSRNVPKTVTEKSADLPKVVCDGCQTTQLREFRRTGSGKRISVSSTVVGVKHVCTHCGGEIKIVKGNLTKTMPAECPMCGKDAAHCVAAVNPPQKS